jgi:uncharacterized membrane protein
MTPLMILQITALMCFLYALKIKMYNKNIVGFVVTAVIFLSIVTSYFTTKSSYADVHYILISILLIFIMFYHTYKSWKRNNIKTQGL